jgi:uncharacterized protein (TIGR03000 family)
MRRLLLLTAMTAGGALGSASTARADGYPPPWPIQLGDIHRDCLPPHATSVTWPSVVPPGWYTNTYRYQWYLPWYAYYNFNSGPYANWMASGGRAGYAYHGPAGLAYSSRPPTQPYLGVWYTGEPVFGQPPAPQGEPNQAPKKDEKSKDGNKDEKQDEKLKDKGEVSITLPADAKLLFNGVAARGSGSVRTFRTPALVPGQTYKYDLTAEVVRNGRTERATGTVIVRAGETARVALTPVPVAVVQASK